MAQAKQCDSEIAKGIWRGPLHGVPIGLKDLCYTTFAPTAGGTTIHAKFTPSFNATIVDRLERAGAVTLGKLKMTEGAYTSHHPDDQAPLNPWNTNYWVGSSSSGSGVATSAGLCYGSIGSDTGGSIRFPSATCGLTGIKPTWGRVSRHGVFPLGRTRWIMSGRCAEPLRMRRRCWASSPVPMSTIRRLCRIRCRTIWRRSATAFAGSRSAWTATYTQDGVDPQVVAALLEAERTLVDSRRRNPRGQDFRPIEKLVSLWIPMCSVETAEAPTGDLSVRASRNTARTSRS